MSDKAATKGSEEQPVKVDSMPQLEEDDEFEEFDTEEWSEQQEDPNIEKLWEEDWDDDQVTDDFCNQLRAELKRNEQHSMRMCGAISFDDEPMQ